MYHFHLPASWLRCLLPWVIVWVLSGVGAVWGCVRVLYLWEPVTPLHSPKSVSFWRHRKQADLHLNRVSAHRPWDVTGPTALSAWQPKPIINQESGTKQENDLLFL